MISFKFNLLYIYGFGWVMQLCEFVWILLSWVLTIFSFFFKYNR